MSLSAKLLVRKYTERGFSGVHVFLKHTFKVLARWSSLAPRPQLPFCLYNDVKR